MALKRWTKDVFVEKAIEKFGLRFNYDKTEYVNARKPIIVTCTIHGDFNTTAYSFLHAKHACPKCQAIVTGVKVSLVAKNRFEKTSTKLFNNIFDYTKSEYKNKDTKLTITCKTHGDFTITPTNHFQLINGGCGGCFYDNSSRDRRSDTTAFIEKAMLVHKDKYDYSLVEYKTSKEKVKLICGVHGVFFQRASKHLEGSGCTSCAVGGFSAHLPSSLYVLSSGDMTKVGITNKSIGIRLRAINNDSKEDFQIVRSYEFSNGIICTDIETEILRYLKSKYENPSRKFDGYSETFLNVDTDDLYSKIEVLLHGK